MQRRTFLKWLAALAALPAVVRTARADAPDVIQRRIPSTGEQIPVIGMGTWMTFDVRDESERIRRAPVLQAFLDRGGRLLDSSPMYGDSEATIGVCLKKVTQPERVFAATKVWTPGRWLGIKQMEASQRLWGVPKFDLMQIHNLLDWETHIETLKQWKADGRIRYIGITTSHGRRHEELEKALTREKFDFVQFTYNIEDRDVERRLLPLAAERGIAVICNRPFQRGDLFDRVRAKPLPDWAQEIDCTTWARFFLKFIVSHPAVTCAIPATRNPDHAIDNMGAARGRLPDAQLRDRMVKYLGTL
jgi:diketogulonate reductase-like aldo/keto reductase